MSEWYPTTAEEVEALPEKPADVEDLWFPLIGEGQILKVVSADGATCTFAGMHEGKWMKATFPVRQSGDPSGS